MPPHLFTRKTRKTPRWSINHKQKIGTSFSSLLISENINISRISCDNKKQIVAERKTFAFLAFTPRSEKARASNAVYTIMSTSVNEFREIINYCYFSPNGNLQFSEILYTKDWNSIISTFAYLLELSMMTSFTDTHSSTWLTRRSSAG